MGFNNYIYVSFSIKFLFFKAEDFVTSRSEGEMSDG